MAKSIDYYLALSSPWTYLAAPRFKDLVAKHSLTVNWKPFNIMHVFGLNGTKPVGQRPKPVQANRLNELRRWHQHLGMPLTLHPKFFPVDPTTAGHMLIAATQEGKGDVMALATGYLTAVWAEERNIADDATLIAVAEAAGFDGAALLEASKSQAAADIFARNTDDAIAANVFGSPIWVYNGELFWGQDRLEFVDRAIEADA